MADLAMQQRLALFKKAKGQKSAPVVASSKRQPLGTASAHTVGWVPPAYPQIPVFNSSSPRPTKSMRLDVAGPFSTRLTTASSSSSKSNSTQKQNNQENEHPNNSRASNNSSGKKKTSLSSAAISSPIALSSRFDGIESPIAPAPIRQSSPLINELSIAHFDKIQPIPLPPSQLCMQCSKYEEVLLDLRSEAARAAQLDEMMAHLQLQLNELSLARSKEKDEAVIAERQQELRMMAAREEAARASAELQQLQSSHQVTHTKLASTQDEMHQILARHAAELARVQHQLDFSEDERACEQEALAVSETQITMLNARIAETILDCESAQRTAESMKSLLAEEVAAKQRLESELAIQLSNSSAATHSLMHYSEMLNTITSERDDLRARLQQAVLAAQDSSVALEASRSLHASDHETAAEAKRDLQVKNERALNELRISYEKQQSVLQDAIAEAQQALVTTQNSRSDRESQLAAQLAERDVLIAALRQESASYISSSNCNADLSAQLLERDVRIGTIQASAAAREEELLAEISNMQTSRAENAATIQRLSTQMEDMNAVFLADKTDLQARLDEADAAAQRKHTEHRVKLKEAATNVMVMHDAMQQASEKLQDLENALHISRDREAQSSLKLAEAEDVEKASRESQQVAESRLQQAQADRQESQRLLECSHKEMSHLQAMLDQSVAANDAIKAAMDDKETRAALASKALAAQVAQLSRQVSEKNVQLQELEASAIEGNEAARLAQLAQQEVQRLQAHNQELAEELQQQNEQLASALEDVAHTEELITYATALKEQLSHAMASVAEAETATLAHASDSQSVTFLNSVLEQQVAELRKRAEDSSASLATLTLSHANEVRRMKVESAEYESSANAMMKQMADQMMTIQTMTMRKIEGLEQELSQYRERK